MRKEGTVSSLVDQLLLDIYGLPDGDRRRSESDSTASSLRIHPQHQHLQKARLLWKSKNDSIRDGNVCVYNARERTELVASGRINVLARGHLLCVFFTEMQTVLGNNIEREREREIVGYLRNIFLIKENYMLE